jgi:hypothetical protein
MAMMVNCGKRDLHPTMCGDGIQLIIPNHKNKAKKTKKPTKKHTKKPSKKQSKKKQNRKRR